MQQQTQFTISHNDQNYGPFTRGEIAERLTSGEFALVDFIYVEEQNDWVTLSEFMPEMAQLNTSNPPAHSISDGHKHESPSPHGFVGTQFTDADVDDFSAVTAKFQLEDYDKLDQTVIESKFLMQPPTVSALAVAPLELAQASDHSFGPTSSSVGPMNAAGAKSSHASLPQMEVTEFGANQEPNAAPSIVIGDGDKIAMQNGVGQVDLMHTFAGNVKLRIKITSGGSLELPASIPIVIVAGKAAKIAIKGPAETEAGQSTTLHFQAVDRFGNQDRNFSGAMSLSLSGSAEGAGAIQFAHGAAQHSVKNNTAETVLVQLHDSEKVGIDASAQLELSVRAGPAVRLEVVAPDEIIAGQAAKLTVKAFDSFGNLATDYAGSVSVEIDDATHDGVHNDGRNDGHDGALEMSDGGTIREPSDETAGEPADETNPNVTVDHSMVA